LTIASESLEDGREAIRTHAWADGFGFLAAADRESPLAPGDLELLAQAAWWTGRLDACIAARERAYAGHLGAGDSRSAGRVAMDLTKDYYSKQAASMGSGWLRQAERLLEEHDDCVELGYLARLQGVIAFEAHGDFDRALAQAGRALGFGERFGDRDLQAVALIDRGRALVAKGDVGEGLPLLDESTAAAVSGELGPMATGIIYCNMITTAGSLGDYRRAGEWTEAAERWCDRQAISGFPGMCRVHRAEIMRLRGAWAEAEKEARRACEELRGFNLEAAGEAFHEVGEIRLRVGDLAAAQEAFEHANALGREPQPGLALLRFAEGRLASAQGCLRRALDEERRDLVRARLLPADVELSIAAGDLERADGAVAELEATAAHYESAAVAAAARTARGRLALALGESEEAARELRRALRLWRELDLPYEAAETRMELARAYWAEEDHDSAAVELRSASASFQELGAVPRERQVADLLTSWRGEAGTEVAAATEHAVRTLMFTDIAKSTKLVEAIGDEGWTDVIGWHDRTLRALFAEHQGQEIDHAGDGFFVAFQDPQGALACAVAIQRRLAEHRQSSGFAPPVRIGLHTTAAARTGGSYRGKGVHAAARIAALAEAGEILASGSAVAGLDSRFRASSSRSVTPKGMSEPIDIVAIEWR
jgi:class 3 adenylate cyclase